MLISGIIAWDTKRFCPGPPPLALRTRLGFGAQDFVVLFCGRLDPDKGSTS